MTRNERCCLCTLFVGNQNTLSFPWYRSFPHFRSEMNIDFARKNQYPGNSQIIPSSKKNSYISWCMHIFLNFRQSHWFWMLFNTNKPWIYTFPFISNWNFPIIADNLLCFVEMPYSHLCFYMLNIVSFIALKLFSENSRQLAPKTIRGKSYG